MIDRIVDFSVRNKYLVFAVVAVACVFGWRAMVSVPIDAIPDLSDTQVIIYTKWDRSPDLVESQVTYPIVSALAGAPGVKSVRGFSDFGYSYVYVIFAEGKDLYWARSRTLEYLSSVLPRLPEGVKAEIGPDATGLGWVFQYVLVDTTGQRSLADIRGYQDWYLRYYLKAVPGVAEVAPVGGYTRQYQIQVDPRRLQAYGIGIKQVVDAVRDGNSDTGGRLVEFGGTEYMIRGRGYAHSIEDFEEIVLQASDTGIPVRIKDVGRVSIGPDDRRGVAELDGQGEAVSGIVVMRQGENALQVIDRVKAKIKEIEPGMPAGMKIVPVYDRSVLIHRSIANVRATIIEVIVTVVLVVLIFLWHFPSAAIPIITMPVVVLLVFIPFQMLGISANIMSLAGLAIAFGELIDASIVVVEQTHKKLERWEQSGRKTDYREVVLGAVKEVAGPTFFALLVLAVSFLPVFALEAQEGRMFKPLAYTKILAMLVAAGLAVTFDPALRLLLTRAEPYAFQPTWACKIANALMVGKVRSEEKHPLSRLLMRIYEPVVRWTLRRKGVVLSVAALLMIVTIPVFYRLGAEFMPPLDEGSVLYMPTTLPGISIGEAQRLLQITDRIIKQFPEVETVLGKAGRAETATDPAPLSMLETTIILKPRSEWRPIKTWYSAWAPRWLSGIFRHITPDTISSEELVAQFDRALKVPGVSNAWTMPVKGRIDMITTGLRTPVGLKISGGDLGEIAKIGMQVEALLPAVRGTRSVFAERTGDGYYLDVDWKRNELARYGLSIDEAQKAVQNAIGGENVSTVVNDQERYPVNVRYMRDFRSDIDSLNHVLVSAGGEKQVLLSELATLQVRSGPAMIRNEDGLLTGYVYVDVSGRDVQSYLNEAVPLLRKSIQLPPGYALSWSGQYVAMQRVKQRLAWIVPVTLLLIVALLYMNTRSLVKTAIVLLAVPFSAIGAVWFLYLAGYNTSVAVWVGLIALLGVDAETGVFMLLYLDLSFEEAKQQGRMLSVAQLREAIVHGAAKRLRPKFMTFATACIGLFPIMWSVGTGSDVMKRIAAPMVGGIFTSFLLELLVYPAIYEIWRSRGLGRSEIHAESHECEDVLAGVH